MISKQPKLQRQKRIFKQVMPRAKQMNINIVTWGRWMKQSSRIPNSRTIAVSQSNEMPPEEQEDKPETPGETPDPQAFGLGGQRPLGLGVAVLPETPPPVPTAPPPVAKKRICVTPPPVPPRLDPEVICCVDICYWCFFFAQEKRFGIFFLSRRTLRCRVPPH
jgi:hypothetical protein